MQIVSENLNADFIALRFEYQGRFVISSGTARCIPRNLRANFLGKLMKKVRETYVTAAPRGHSTFQPLGDHLASLRTRVRIGLTSAFSIVVLQMGHAISQSESSMRLQLLALITTLQDNDST